MKHLEKPLKAMANRRRLAILSYLKQHHETPVYEIASAIKLSIKATSKHLRILSAVDIIDREQRGLEVYYFIASNPMPPVNQILSLL